jgi:hypothetical protein
MGEISAPQFFTGENFQIQHENSGNGCLNRGRNPAGGLAECRAFLSRRTIRPVFGGISGYRESCHPQQVVSRCHEVAPWHVGGW